MAVEPVAGVSARLQSWPHAEAATANPGATEVSLGTASEPTPYRATIDVVDGVITGDNVLAAPSRRPLTYTAIGGPAAGGKVTLDPTTGDFTFLPNATQLNPGGADQFRVLVDETTVFDAQLERLPLVGLVVKPIVLRLHQIPVVSEILSPLIGRSRIYTVDVPVGSFVDGAPIAFTTTVISFDGTPISTNYFPALGLQTGQRAPTVLNGPSLATAGYTDPTQQVIVSGAVPGLAPLRANGYNVVTWDPRGEFASGGRLHLDSENFEARDVSAIIDWLTTQPGTKFGPGPSGDDPLLGMVGGSYGGGIQLTTAGTDKRIDAIAPVIAWNSLNTALYPADDFKTSFASLLLLALVTTGARLDPEIYAGIATGVTTGFLTRGEQDFLAENSPATVVENITAPTLFLQGTVDGLFTLQQALDNAEALSPDVPVKMIWYCGGHGACLDPVDTGTQTSFLVSQQLDWLDTYVKNKATAPQEVPGPKFTWVDQQGEWYSSDALVPDLDTAYVDVQGAGGVLPILPFFGGSGPQNLAPFPISITAAKASDIALEVPVPSRPTTTHVVGAPELTLTYSGFGTSRHIYAQLVDNQTGRVLGNLVSPIPVRLDGRPHTVTFPMENIAYTMDPGDTLTLQIVDSATAYEDFTAFGLISVTDIALALPVADRLRVVPITLPDGIAWTRAGGAEYPAPFGIPR